MGTLFVTRAVVCITVFIVLAGPSMGQKIRPYEGGFGVAPYMMYLAAVVMKEPAMVFTALQLALDAFDYSTVDHGHTKVSNRDFWCPCLLVYSIRGLSGCKTCPRNSLK